MSTATGVGRVRSSDWSVMPRRVRGKRGVCDVKDRQLMPDTFEMTFMIQADKEQRPALAASDHVH